MKYIKGYEGLYGITSCGRVWSYRSKKFLTLQKSKKGYLTILLSKNGVKKRLYVHRLVAEAYIPNINNLPEVNHKDEDKTHNWIANLEWCDRKYNCNYGSRNDWLKRKVKCVETGQIFNSITEAANSINRRRESMWNCLSGKYKTCGKLHWQYVEVEEGEN